MARLSPLSAIGFDVEVMPDRESKYNKPSQNPRISILYESSEFSPDVVRGIPATLSTNDLVMTEYATLAIVFRARILRGAKGLHSVADQSRRWLMGFRPSDWGRIMPKDFSFTEFDGGIWVYTMHVVCTGMLVQDTPDQPTDGLPLFKEGTINYP